MDKLLIASILSILASTSGDRGCKLVPQDTNQCVANIQCFLTLENIMNEVINWPCGHYTSIDYEDNGHKSIKFDKVFSIILTIDYGNEEYQANYQNPIDGLQDRIRKVIAINIYDPDIPRQIVYDVPRLIDVELHNNSFFYLDLKNLLSHPNLEMINASHNTIENVGEDYDQIEYSSFSKVKTIDLSYNNIQNIPHNMFANAIELRYLNLSHNTLVLPEISYAGLTDLISLRLSYNPISSTQFLSNLVNLKELLLDHNRISEIKESIGFMRNLEILDLNSNFIKYIEEDTFQSLLNLKILNLNNNKISYFSNTMFRNNKKLYSLSLLQNDVEIKAGALLDSLNVQVLEIDKLAKQFEGLVNASNFEGIEGVTELDLSGGSITDLHSEAFLTYRHTIRSLNLSSNLISKISNTTFQSLEVLRDLDLSNNRLNNINFKFNESLSLKTLNIRSNSIETITSNTFINLRSLQKLDLSHNKNHVNFTERLNFGHARNPSIKQLDLSYCEIQNISTIIVYNINSLISLTLSRNKIEFIDEVSFQTMPDLSLLDLSFNLISFIKPGSFLHTNNVRTLNLHSNKIPSIQFGVLDGLANLDTLNISSNNLHSFSANLLHNTPRLSTLALDDNFIKKIAFKDFTHAYIKVISIGGNLISCHDIIDIKKIGISFAITADSLTQLSEHAYGISCISNSGTNSSVTFSDERINVADDSVKTTKNIGFDERAADKNAMNIITTYFNNSQNVMNGFMRQLKDISVLTSFNIKHNDEYIKNQTKIASDMVDINKNQANITENQLQVIITVLENMRTANKDVTNVDLNQSEFIENQLKVMTEMRIALDNMKNTNTRMNNYGSQSSTERYEIGDVKALLYVIAICMIMTVSVFVVKFVRKLRSKNSFIRRNGLDNGNQPIVNLEL